jgi:oligopeptide/dipeptide ABC transporter ATP-binding protein
MPAEPLLEARAVLRRFPASGGSWFAPRALHTAVDGVSLVLHKGETVALVGESGSGKTTLGRMLLGLDTPDAGAVLFRGADVARLDRAAWRGFRRDVQVVFQDSGGSLNPRRSIAGSIAVPLRHNLGLGGAAVRRRVDALLERVELTPAQFRDRLPHELSGGQRQRVGIARALASNPRVIVADEPVSALDVSVRAQVLRLLRDLQRQDGLATLFITHDLGVVRAIADRVVVLYRGAVMEQGATPKVMGGPLHPYTRALLAAQPGAVARPKHPGAGRPFPNGCRYAAACPIAAAICATAPALRALGGRRVACHFAEGDDHGTQ